MVQDANGEVSMSRDELSVDMSSLMQEASAASVSAPSISPGTSVPQPDADDGFEAPDSPFWSDSNKEFGDLNFDEAKAPDNANKTATSRADEAAKSAALTYKANGKEHTLDLSNPEVVADVQRKLAMADGMKKAFAEQAKTKQQMVEMQAQLAEAREFKDSWDKLEQLKYDKSKLFEVLTGQKYDDLIQEEVAKHNIKTMGTDEDRQLLTQQERIKALEDRLKFGEEKTAKEVAHADKRKAAAEKAQEAAQQEQLKTSIDREFFKNVDASMADDVKELVYQKSILDLKKLHKTYGKVTNKMVEKTFAENSKRLKSFQQEALNTIESKAIDSKKQTATAAAQAASTKNYQGDADMAKLAKLNPTDLFRAFKFQNSKSK